MNARKPNINNASRAKDVRVAGDVHVQVQAALQVQSQVSQLKVKVKEPSKNDELRKTFLKNGIQMKMKLGQKAGSKKPKSGANISYWLPWWNRMEREAEKEREELKKNRIVKYLKPMKPISSPRVI